MALTLDNYRSFLKRKIMAQGMATASTKRGQLRMPGAGGTRMLAGHQLAATNPFIERIRATDPDLATRLMGYFKTLPKYSALEILLDDRTGAVEKFGYEVQGILDAVLTEEMRADGTEKRLADAQG